jgi:hypothetical protein
MAITWPLKNNFTDGEVLTAANMNNIGDTVNVFNPTSAANGTVLTANGSGGVSYAAINAGALTLLSTASLNGQTTVTVSNISQAYEHLLIYIDDPSQTVVSGGGCQLYPNGTGASADIYATGWYNNSTTYTNDNGLVRLYQGATNEPLSSSICWIYKYSSTTMTKLMEWQYYSTQYTIRNWLFKGCYASNTAVTSLTFQRASVSGSLQGTAQIYGVK